MYEILLIILDIKEFQRIKRDKIFEPYKKPERCHRAFYL